MAKDILGEAGLHFDELNKLRVLDPEVTQQTIELKEECKDFFGQNWPISENSW
jgi:intraflagellar transport protein 20